MLDELAAGNAGDTEVQDLPQHLTGQDIYDPNAPLPSYDLEEVSAEQAMNSEPGRSLKSLAAQAESPLAADEPFTEDEPLPSFPLGSEAEAEAEELQSGVSFSEEDAVEISKVDDYIPAAEAVQQAVEEVLDEADFFAARGLYEDARAILVEQLTRTPNHPLVLERIREIASALGSSGSQTIERSQIGASASQEPPDYDIANALGALDELEPQSEHMVASPISGNAERYADQVFASFKAGIRASVSDESDSATRYDLGVAYKEMGLIVEAINEFEIAARDSTRECMCFAMIGLIYLEQNELDRASESYVRALSASTKTVEQEMSLYYDLGNVYEMKGKNQDALYYFQKIARRDPGYRDVSDRIMQLQPDAEVQPHHHHAPQRQVAVNDQDEFDAVFDDLFNNKR
jgi:tetratricopeptide (TPR) repeat protein